MPKPTPIVNTSTVDNDSGFVFVSNVNFNFTSNYKEINKEHREKKEQATLPYYRRYAQYVLSNDEVSIQTPEAERTVELQMPPKGLLVQQTVKCASPLCPAERKTQILSSYSFIR